MPRYSVYGHILSTDIAFPELRAAEGPPSWTLRRGDGEPPPKPGVEVGRDDVGAGVQATLVRTRDGFRLTFDDTGTFDVESGGGELLWYPRVDSDPELSRIDLLGRVLAVAAHMRGGVCLHGSAVSIEDSAVAFLAPKGYGKSTLALALVQDGAKLMTDDTLPIDIGDTISARPGVHSVRLWRDSASHFEGLGQPRLSTSRKENFDALPDAWLMREARPLGAIYLLSPPTGGAGAPVVRRRLLAPIEATIGLVTHSKLGALLGKEESGRVLVHVGTVTSRVPVYALEVTRDLPRVREAAAEIRGWHTPPERGAGLPAVASGPPGVVESP